MKTIFSIIYILLFAITGAQTKLSADGEGDTYEIINNVFAPGYDVVEVPDCAHQDFGRHIREIYDDDLKTHVFQFIAHVTPDNDRCKKFDRQRIEIKTYGNSPDSLKATQGETVEYRWLFKIPRNFKVSKSFTHLHQIKSVGGLYASMPMVTLTARKSSAFDKLELRMTSTNKQTTKTSADLDVLRGRWVSAREIIHFDEEGSYFLELRDVLKDKLILEYNSPSTDMWQDGAKFARPKWGIYRSLNNNSDLKDETVSFNYFWIKELDPMSINLLNSLADKNTIYLNDTNSLISLKDYKVKAFDNVKLFNSTAVQLDLESKKEIDFSKRSDGLYYLAFFKAQKPVKVLKFMVLN